MIAFNVKMDPNLSPDKSSNSHNLTKMDIDSQNPATVDSNGDNGDSGSGSGGEEGGKQVPLELTAYGTTPSGKPRLFVCQVCTRAFARLEHLRRHERSHTKEKPFTCGVCQRKFSRRDLLLRHAQKLHAGCADAITRLRRKSVKRASEDMNMSSPNDQPTPISSSSHNDNHGNDINFNLNLFGPDSLQGSQFQNIPHMSRAQNNPHSSKTSSHSPSMSDKSSQSHNRSQSQTQSTTNSYLNSNIHAIPPPSYHNPQSSSLSHSHSHSHSNSMSNLSPFPLQRSQSQLSQYSQHSTTPFKKSRRNSDLSRQMLSRGRGASFSAQSGPNYAVNVPEFNDLYPGAENVEFSTPQLIPSQSYDENSWLNNLSHIPGMGNEEKEKKLDLANLQYMMPTATMNDDIKTHENSHNTEKNNGQSNKNSGAGTGTTQKMNYKGNGSNSSTPNTNIPHPSDAGSDKEFYGYSFYDIPESMMSKNFTGDFRSHSNLTPIKQEFEEDHLNLQMDSPRHNNSHNQSNPLASDFDLNFINDIGELANEIDINSKFLSNGYSFYGDNPSVSSSNIESPGPGGIAGVPGNSLGGAGYSSLTPNSNINPGNNPNFINQSQLLNIENTTNLNNLKLTNYSKNKMFTNNLRAFINRTLNKYPINGVTNPIIPSNEKLEFYLTNFIDKFLAHFSFIHLSKLNEYEIMNMTSNEDYGNESSRACLPLLMATIGALLSNNKSDSEHLYEASRRTIHIYLETRKQSNESKNNPLWLIQSLTLSVIYGLFSDNENNVFIVIRQLNALNSLVKTSIKEKQKLNSKIFFSINKDDESNLANNSSANGSESDPKLTTDVKSDDIKHRNNSETGSLFGDNSAEDEIKYANNINLQSQFRIIFMIYRLTNFLLVFYNIPLTLSINDLNNLEIPSKTDETIWNFKNYQQYKEFNHVLNGSNNTSLNSNSVMGSNSGFSKNKLIFKDLLLKISKNSNMNFNTSNSLKCLNNLSKFGFLTLIHGIFEINQFNNNLNTINILNNLSMFLKSETCDYQIIDYSILNNFIKISSVIDFKLLKQQSWLKNYQELLKNYEKLLNSVKLNEFSKIDKILDYCLFILKFLLLKVEKFKYNKANHNTDGMADIGVKEEDSFEDFEDIDDLSFEKILDIKFTKNLNSGIELNVILSQCMFHVFSIMSILLLLYLKSTSILPNYKLILHRKFKAIFSFLNHIQVSLNLPTIYQLALNVNDSDFTNEDIMNNDPLLPTSNSQSETENLNDLNFSNILYMLNVGELLLLQTFNHQLKFSIFEKLSTNLSQIRKFLINNEHRLGGF